MAKLIIVTDGVKKTLKLSEKDQFGNVVVKEDAALSAIDYLTSNYASLDNFAKTALDKHWINEASSYFAIEIDETKICDVEFGNDLIKVCSKIACSHDGYIKKNEDNGSLIINDSFNQFMDEFIGNSQTDLGQTMINNGYFSKYPDFERFLKIYRKAYLLDEIRDDMYTNNDINRLDGRIDFRVSYNVPSTMNDFLRNYDLFRLAFTFNKDYLKLKNKELQDAIVVKNLKGSKLDADTLNKLYNLDLRYNTQNKESNSDQFANKRSLCFLIGNNAAPLILETMDPLELDVTISDNFKNSKEIIKKYQPQIDEYLKNNIDYLNQVRTEQNRSDYNGHVSILVHDKNGNFVRKDNMYERKNIIYTNDFKNVNKIFVNISKFKKIARSKKSNVAAKNQAVHELGTIVDRLKLISNSDSSIFTPSLNNKTRFVRATNIDDAYVFAINEWKKQFEQSDSKFEVFRKIKQIFKKKNINILDSDKENEFFPENEDVSGNTSYLDSMHIRGKKLSTKQIAQKICAIPEDEEDEYEEILEPHEYEQMYMGDTHTEDIDVQQTDNGEVIIRRRR